MNDLDKTHKQTAYKNEYNIKNYANISIRVRPDFKTDLQVYCQKHKMSVAGFIQKACKYCIDNDIDFD